VRDARKQQNKHLAWASFWRLDLLASRWEDRRKKSQGCNKYPFGPSLASRRLGVKVGILLRETKLR
jgi:hypothetical protein